MAVTKSSQFVLRFLGLTGVFLAAAGGVLWLAFRGETLAWVGIGAIVVGLGLLAVSLLSELGGLTKTARSPRGMVGGTVVVQVLLAALLVIGVNWCSYQHYERFDWTSNHEFTLPAEIREQMAQLRGETDIVILQQHVSFGQRAEVQQDDLEKMRQRRYDLAAQKKIVEKVRDLSELFQDLGPRFHVRALDIEDEDFDSKLKAIRQREIDTAKTEKKDPASPLADAIEKAPENSIFFHSEGKVQRLAFHDIYEVDKEESEKANNLVLNYQGPEPFARKILNVEEKKPRVTLAVVHSALSMTSRDHPLLTMNGAKKALEAQGFVCNDLLLRKQDPEGGLSQDAAALSYDESRFEQIEEELGLLEEGIRKGERELPSLQELQKAWQKQTLAELNKKYTYISLPNGQRAVVPLEKVKELENRKIPFKQEPVDEQDRTDMLRIYNREVAAYERELADAVKERNDLVAERDRLNVDQLAERKRIADVEAKMRRMLADTDLLVIPRFTYFHLPTEQIISNKVHKLDDTQLRAIKAFLKEGKPVLCLLGPVNEKREMPPEFGGGGDDRLETVLAELGIVLPKQTILYSAEMKEFNERKAGLGFSTKELDLPPALFNWERGTGQLSKKTKAGGANPIRESLDLTRRSVGKAVAKALQIRHPRPVYALAAADVGNPTAGTFDESAVFLMVDENTWNENSPFLNEKREVPRYHPTPPEDPKKGTLEEERHGPFPIGVAVERTIPADWYDGKAKPAKARLAVIGTGGVFVGQSLNPMKEKLLLDVSNWLLGRDDLLARSVGTWSFPRVELSDNSAKLWHWGMFLGLPLVFAYVGMVMWFVRRMR